MRMRDWEREIAKRPITNGEVLMLEVWNHVKHGNARHRNWLKRKLLEMAPRATEWRRHVSR